jgi:cell division protein FtsN
MWKDTNKGVKIQKKATMANNILIWIIAGVILIAIIFVIVILFSRKNKKQIEVSPMKLTKTQEENYKEHPNYPSELEQRYALNQTENFEVPIKPTKVDEEDYYTPQGY